jgi:hypothetical protein
MPALRFRDPIRAISGSTVYPGASIEVREADDSLAPIYAEPAFQTPIPNPLKADAAGFFPPIYGSGYTPLTSIITDADGVEIIELEDWGNRPIAADDDPRDNAGSRMPGATRTFYQGDTTELAVIYSDSGLTTPADNPQVADENGLFDPVYIDSDLIYRVMLHKAPGNPAVKPAWGHNALKSYTGGVLVYDVELPQVPELPEGGLSGAILISINDYDYSHVAADGRFYNSTKELITDPRFYEGTYVPLPFEFLPRLRDAAQYETLVGFDYNGGLYDGTDFEGPFTIPPYPTEVLEQGWRARDATSGGFILKNIPSAMRIDTLYVVVDFPVGAEYNPVVNITVGSVTRQLDAAIDAPPAAHIGSWARPTVTDEKISINWVPEVPGNSQFSFAVIEAAYTLVGPYLLSVNDGLPIGYGSTGVSLQGRNLATATSITIDGVTQTLTDAGRRHPTFTLNRAGMNYGSHTLAIAGGGKGSEAEAILGPQDGWLHVDIGASLYADSSLRVSATPELAEDDQLAYSTEEEKLLISNDGSIVYYGAMPADVDAEVWSNGDWTTGQILLGAGSGNEDL